MWPFPDTAALGQGDKPQHNYSVRFAATELWGSRGHPKDVVYADLFEDYLEADFLDDPKMVEPKGLENLPLLPRDEEGPVFEEPWQAQAFAVVVKLNEAGLITWKEWADCLAQCASRSRIAWGIRYWQALL